jgi:hypothetical protein
MYRFTGRGQVGLPGYAGTSEENLGGYLGTRTTGGTATTQLQPAYDSRFTSGTCQTSP